MRWQWCELCWNQGKDGYNEAVWYGNSNTESLVRKDNCSKCSTVLPVTQATVSKHWRQLTALTLQSTTGPVLSWSTNRLMMEGTSLRPRQLQQPRTMSQGGDVLTISALTSAASLPHNGHLCSSSVDSTDTHTHTRHQYYDLLHQMAAQTNTYRTHNYDRIQANTRVLKKHNYEGHSKSS